MDGIKRGTQSSDIMKNKHKEEALAKDEAAYDDRTETTIDVPVELVPAVRELIAKHQTSQHPKTTVKNSG